MKYKTLIKKLRLGDAEFKAIKDAVAAAEAKTTGEIAVAVTPESARYCFWELLAADFLQILGQIDLDPLVAPRDRGVKPDKAADLSAPVPGLFLELP